MAAVVKEMAMVAKENKKKFDMNAYVRKTTRDLRQSDDFETLQENIKDLQTITSPGARPFLPNLAVSLVKVLSSKIVSIDHPELKKRYAQCLLSIVPNKKECNSLFPLAINAIIRSAYELTQAKPVVFPQLLEDFDNAPTDVKKHAQDHYAKTAKSRNITIASDMYENASQLVYGMKGKSPGADIATVAHSILGTIDPNAKMLLGQENLVKTYQKIHY